MRVKFYCLCFLMISFSVLASREDVLDRYSIASKIFVTDYNTGNFDKIWSRGDKNFKLSVDKVNLFSYLKEIRENLGKIEFIDEPELTSIGCIYKVHFVNKNLYLIMMLDENEGYTSFAFIDRPEKYGIVLYPTVNEKTTVDEMVKPYLKLPQAAGLAVGIIENGRRIEKFYGTVNKELYKKPEQNTEFELGAITEVFTAISLLEMNERGIININKNINNYLPSGIKTISFKGRKIKIKDLATHTSGLPVVPDNIENTVKDQLNPYANYTCSDLNEFLNKFKLKEVPGSNFKSSTLGYGLLSYIMTLKTGITFDEIIKKEICCKLGMKDTVVKFNVDQKLRMANGYLNNGKPAPLWDNHTLSGANALKSTLQDMMSFLEENLKPGGDALGRAVKQSHKVQFKDKFINTEHAYGWDIIDLEGRKVIWKYGGTAGFRCAIAFFEGTETGLVVMANSAVENSEMIMKLLEMLAQKLDDKGSAGYAKVTV